VYAKFYDILPAGSPIQMMDLREEAASRLTPRRAESLRLLQRASNRSTRSCSRSTAPAGGIVRGLLETSGNGSRKQYVYIRLEVNLKLFLGAKFYPLSLSFRSG